MRPITSNVKSVVQSDPDFAPMYRPNNKAVLSLELIQPERTWTCVLLSMSITCLADLAGG